MTAAFRFSPRAVKYVWLSLPGLAALGLSAAWLFSVAPAKQADALQATEWKEEIREQKERADFLQEHQVYSDYDQIILQGVSADAEDMRALVWSWAKSPIAQAHEPEKIIRLLDQFHTCLGYYANGQIYLEQDTPGLCSVPNGGVDDALRNARKV